MCAMELSREQLEWAFAHRRDDVSALALGKLPWDGEARTLLLRQVSARQMLEKKVPDWSACPWLEFPASLPLEQCSSQRTALYKLALVKKLFPDGKEVCEGLPVSCVFPDGKASPESDFAVAKTTVGADLTGGLGIDAWFLSSHFETYHYVERQEELCRLAGNNFSELNKTLLQGSASERNAVDCRRNIEVHQSEADEWLSSMERVNFLYLDPSRRDEKGRKVAALADCSPDVARQLPALLAKTDVLMLKLSPMLDVSLALSSLPGTRQVHVVAVDNDCKELLFVLAGPGKAPDSSELSGLPRATMAGSSGLSGSSFGETPDSSGLSGSEPEFFAVNLRKDGRDQLLRFYPSDEANAVCPLADSSALLPGRYLLEPNVAVLKAGAFKLPALAFGLEKLHANTHLYLSDGPVPEFPGKCLRIEQVLPPSAKSTKQCLRALERAEVVCRNYPETVDSIRRKYGLAGGGDRYVYALTAGDGRRWLLVCQLSS